jgi:hypothetical protein
MTHKLSAIAILATTATLLLCGQALALTTKLPTITPGRYWLGGTDQGLEIEADQYRYYSEGGEGPWQPLSDLSPVQTGVIFDGKTHWCLSTMAPNGPATCTQRGWVTSQPDRKPLFACTTENDKQILLFDAGRTIDYSFGRPNATPELELSIPRDQASTWQWHGFGRTMTYSVEVPNRDAAYRVFWSLDKLSKTHDVEAGVTVMVDHKPIATVKCTDITVNNLRGVDLQPIKH